MNLDVKVYKGEDHPIKRLSQSEKFFHNHQIDFPLTKKEEKENLVDFMVVHTIKKNKKSDFIFISSFNKFCQILSKRF